MVVYHIFGGEMQLYTAVIGGFQLFKACAEFLRAVGAVLHYMWGEPQGFYAQLLLCGKDTQCFINGFHAIVHSREYVGVVVGGTAEYAACRY